MRPLAAHAGKIRGLKLSGGIGGLVAIQLLATFAVQIIVLRVVGAGRETDAFIGAQTIPLLTASIVGTALQSVWQPRLAIAASVDWQAQLERALAMSCAIILPIALLFGAASGPLIDGLFGSFDPAQVELTLTLTRITLVGLPFNILALILAAGGRAIGKFVAVEAVPALLSLLSLAAIGVLLPSTGIEGATWFLSIRGVATFLLLWIMLGYPLPRNLRDERFSATVRGAFALMGGSSFYKLGPLVDRYWGARAPSGQLTLYNLAQSGVGAAASLLERAIALPVVPRLSRDLHNGNNEMVRRYYRRALALIWMTVLLCMIIGCLGALSAEAFIIDLLHIDDSQFLFLLMLGFAFSGFLGVAAGGAVINSIFYSMGDVKTPISVGTAGFFLGVAIKSAAFLSDGLVAMAVGTSVYYTITMVVMVTILERRLNAREPR
jgi:peptidoglycan biosynthesis protein MviN/MurJ (putative lipid II flippase)